MRKRPLVGKGEIHRKAAPLYKRRRFHVSVKEYFRRMSETLSSYLVIKWEVGEKGGGRVWGSRLSQANLH